MLQSVCASLYFLQLSQSAVHKRPIVTHFGPIENACRILAAPQTRPEINWFSLSNDLVDNFLPEFSSIAYLIPFHSILLPIVWSEKFSQFEFFRNLKF